MQTSKYIFTNIGRRNGCSWPIILADGIRGRSSFVLICAKMGFISKIFHFFGLIFHHQMQLGVMKGNPLNAALTWPLTKYYNL